MAQVITDPSMVVLHTERSMSVIRGTVTAAPTNADVLAVANAPSAATGKFDPDDHVFGRRIIRFDGHGDDHGTAVTENETNGAVRDYAGEQIRPLAVRNCSGGSFSSRGDAA